MKRSDYIVSEKRLYNKWVASQTLEDFALRYTADRARKWSAGTVANTAIGATAFLACEAIGASVTLNFGFANSAAAICAAMVVMFLVGLPIAYYAAREGLDVDLLTRGAGFGYLGSTITSLIYASFTFLLFAVEASIMSVALEVLLGIHISIAHVISTLVVIPIALYGMSTITRFQAITQPLWLFLQFAPFAFIALYGGEALDQWTAYVGELGGEGINIVLFGLAFSTLLSLLPQIGEQADYLRFLPRPEKSGRFKWWLAVLVSGPGWTLVGGAKLLLGSFLAVYVLQRGGDAVAASSPMSMFQTIFTDMFSDARVGLLATGVFVVVCQLKINVTNAYAGSIAWSNFFSRLTHSHPGRVVWLIFNVVLALLLMEMGIFAAIEQVLVLYAILASGWIGALVGDLVISKPLGISPPGIEFKRAHLYDINPVGIGAMAISVALACTAYVGLIGETAQAFAPFIGLLTAFLTAPVIAIATRGRYYLARTPTLSATGQRLNCVICENDFQPRDMAHCPMFDAPICSLCCTLEVRCMDMCKSNSRVEQQASRLFERWLPAGIAQYANSAIGYFVILMCITLMALGGILYFIHWFHLVDAEGGAINAYFLLRSVFVVFALIAGVTVWIIILAHKSRQSAFRETASHMEKLVAEIAAHEATDRQLQKAKMEADSANIAKSRFLVSVSHEIRSPLNSIYGYAQLLERGVVENSQSAGQIIRRSSEHLTNLVEGLMEISQVEGGVLKLDRELIRFPVFLEQIVSMLRPQAQAKGLAFRFEIDERTPQFVRTDPKRLRQVLINVLANAIKFTMRGEVVFKVSYRNQIAHFEIQDTGVGISPSDMERIFEPFERVGVSGPGIGLGLSITRVLTHIMGGDISVESEVGVGTRFHIRLMLSQPLQEEIDRTRTEEREEQLGLGQKVLIIDDDANQLMIVKSFLQTMGYEVTTARSVDEGVSLAAGLEPAFALLDVNMPGRNGWEAAKALRDMFGSRILTIMISADAQSAKSSDPQNLIHDIFLAKPFDFDSLALALSRSRIVPAATSRSVREDSAREPVVTSSDTIAQHPSFDRNLVLTQLAAAARTGHISAVRQSIAELEANMGVDARTLIRLKEHLLQFDLKSIVNFVEDCRLTDD